MPLKPYRKAFTLLELLVVVSILAIIGGAIIPVISSNIFDNAKRDMNLSSMSQIRDALLRFRQDMGYFPGQGPRLNAANLDLSLYDDSEYYGSGGTASEWAELSDDNRDLMNFWQLIHKPKVNSDGDFWDYDLDARRGWNGPYLVGYNLRYNDYQYNGSTYQNIRALSDGYDEVQEVISGAGFWSLAGDPAQPLNRAGRPLRLMMLDDDCYYLVSCGPDGVLDTSVDDYHIDVDDVGMALGRD
jgi:prepilin-type N-terminal cleavage/methylation domain-containing protein